MSHQRMPQISEGPEVFLFSWDLRFAVSKLT
jgi:hypothetical protein